MDNENNKPSNGKPSNGRLGASEPALVEPEDSEDYLVKTTTNLPQTTSDYSMGVPSNGNPSTGYLKAVKARVDEVTPLLKDPDADSIYEPPEEPVIQTTTRRRLIITLLSMWMGVFLSALDSTIIATLSATISISFNSLSLLSWLASAFLIANAVCQPLSGRLTDIFGRRVGLVVANILFASGNLLCGFATNIWMMIVGRVIAGMGGGGLTAICTFVSSDLVPLRKRGLIQGLGFVFYGAGAALGGLYGGWVHDNWGWRWAFLSQVPFVVVSGTLVHVSVKIPSQNKSSKSKLRRVDFLGALFLAITMALFLLGLNSGGNIVPWDHPLVLVPLLLSFSSLLAFIYIETYIASEPILLVKLLLTRTIAATCLADWCGTMVIYMITFYIPIFYQIAGYSTTAAGLRLVPDAIGSAVGAVLSGFTTSYTGKYKLLGLVMVSILIIGSGLLSTLTFKGAVWPVFIYMFMCGLGYSGMLTITLLATISSVSYEHQAVATSANFAFRSTGSTLGVTIAGAVYQNILLKSLHARFDSYANSTTIIPLIRNHPFETLKHLPDGWKEGVMASFHDALRGVFLVASSVSIFGFICAVFMRQHTLHMSINRRDSQISSFSAAR